MNQNSQFSEMERKTIYVPKHPKSFLLLGITFFHIVCPYILTLEIGQTTSKYLFLFSLYRSFFSGTCHILLQKYYNPPEFKSISSLNPIWPGVNVRQIGINGIRDL